MQMKPQCSLHTHKQDESSPLGVEWGNYHYLSNEIIHEKALLSQKALYRMRAVTMR